MSGPRPSMRAARMTLRVPERRHWSELIKFSLVGGLGFLVNLGVYVFACQVLGVHYLLAGVLAFAVASVNNYVINRAWTFPGRGNTVLREYARFLVVGCAALAGNLAALRVLVERLGMSKVIAQVVAVGLVTPGSFLGNKLWTFGTRGPRPG